MQPSGVLSTFLENLCKDLQAKNGKLASIPVKLWYTPSEETLKLESAAITAMNAPPKGSRAQRLWDYILDFQHTPKPSNFLHMFPELAQALASGGFRGGEHTAVMAALPDVGGYAFVQGGPGSGKSTLGATICHSLRAEMTQSSRATSSMSQFAKHLTLPQDATTSLPSHGTRPLVTDTTDYIANLVGQHDAARKLLVRAVETCHVICATPVAFAQMINHVPDLEISLVVVDEAGRMTEASSLVSVSKCPNVPHWFTGDTRPYTPGARTRNDYQLKDFFRPQRDTSLFKRIGNVGGMTATLHDNHRARGRMANWAVGALYDNEIVIVNSSLTDPVRDLQNWLSSAIPVDKASSSIFVLDIAESTEILVGTSYANPINAIVGCEFVISAYQAGKLWNAVDFSKMKEPCRVGTTLIIVGYSAQKSEWEGRLRQTSPAEAPLSMIEVRTIDDSPSHEADLVIVDLTRKDKAGFLNQEQRLTVLATRARIGMVILGTKKCTTMKTGLGNLFNYVEKRNAYALVRHRHPKAPWNKFCTHCIQHGHYVNECTVTLRCSICHAKNQRSDHALRNCKRAGEHPFPEEYGARKASDGVDRDPLSYRQISAGKRVNMRRAKK
ncbi:hypothetical protein AK830_g2907 [Neonectria ditissima]|uniref:DNA2/NAM7 helicase-like C-terminal domain-containing protein n=1 Tax=Neonectria ditissima TaxID=78410 RepID=A0A0P7B112_9HYPO|nr:hypothetical protein AK830_g2907 [Neonectria ditissima]